MLNILPGLTVAREIPFEVIRGLLTGQLTLHGGVIRWAAGTAKAGQIVRHLLPLGTPALAMLPLSTLPGIGQVAQAFQLARLQGAVGTNIALTERVLQMATGTMALSGLNLALSAVGFVVLGQRLSSVEKRLAEIQRDVKVIREILERQSRAKLRAALTSLEKADQTVTAANRRDLLSHAHHDLEPLLHEYGELLTLARDVESAMVAEEHYLLIALAQVRCSAELGEFHRAHREFVAARILWQGQARRIAQELLLGKDPERLLYQETVSVLPTAGLIACLDFAHATDHGMGWLDTLRGKMPNYYSDRGVSVGVKMPKDRTDKRRHEREVVVPSLVKLTARGQLMEGYRAELDLLVEHQVTPGELGRRIAEAAPAAVEGYLILEPAVEQKVDMPEEAPSPGRGLLLDRLFKGRGDRAS
jgi:hypothetical protein